MIKNYFKIAFRNLRKNKIDSAISIGGLAVGLACCILLVFYVRFEWSHDNFHVNKDRVFRITEKSIQPDGEEFKTLTTSHPLAAALDSTFPEIEETVNVTMEQVQLEVKGRFVTEIVTFADPAFFKLFTFPLLYGNQETALESNDGVVLTEQKAHQLFGTENAVGKTLNFKLGEQTYSYEVTGIAQQLPANSSIQFEILLPFESFFRVAPKEQISFMKTSWHIGFGETWVMLRNGKSKEELESKFPEFIKKYMGEFAVSRKKQMALQPLNGAYFDQEFTSYITGNTNKLYSSVLAGIALIILAIAGMNFMSLTLSRASQRGHEMGIRISSGAQRKQIISQLYGEIFITCFIAFIFGLVLAELSSPLFQSITGKAVEVNLISDPLMWLILLVMVLLLTLITGSYPAIIMASQHAGELFSSTHTTQRIPVFVKVLIATQFALSIAFLIGTFTMSRQLNYLLNKDLGFSSAHVIAVEINGENEESAQHAELFAKEAKRLSSIQQVSISGSAYRQLPASAPSSFGFGMATLRTSSTLEGFDGSITSEIIDENYVQVMGLNLLQGRNFSSDRPSDLKNGFLINQAFADKMGWEHPVGKIIVDKNERWTSPFNGKEVIGVVENFHFRPLYEQLKPIALQHIDANDFTTPQTILIKAGPGSMREAINQLSGLWNELIPTVTFKYNFLDDLVAAQYKQEKRWTHIIRFSSIMAIALACFGLFGLAALSAQRRTKEIGIRKVLGASVTNIVALLSKDFVKLVLIGFVIAIPIAWYAMNRWLADFAYKIDIGPGIFVLAGAASLLIALLTVSWQSIKAAVANPVESLKSE
jgi:putative ABC transport system permease protein